MKVRLCILSLCGLLVMTLVLTVNAVFLRRTIILCRSRDSRAARYVWSLETERYPLSYYQVEWRSGLWHDSGYSGMDGFSFDWDIDRTSLLAPRERYYASAPLWFPAVLLILASYLAWRRCLRFRHPTFKLCHTCGYDLRAHHPGEKCPECGSPVPTPKDPEK